MNDAMIVETRYQDLYTPDDPFTMESGATLPNVTVAYETYGTLDASGTNAVLVCHALTGSAHAAGLHPGESTPGGWWDSFIGPGKPLDTERFFVICSNFLGSCYGTTGPLSVDPSTGRPYGMTFPQMTVRDMVTVQKRLIDQLGVRQLRTVIGGSLGGMQVLEWGVMFPDSVASLIPIATSAQHSAWSVGLNDIGRQAIMNDPDWRGGEYHGHGQPRRGLSLARQVAMMSYRSEREFAGRFGRAKRQENGDRFDPENIFQVESYLRHQGKKLVDRFDANTYLYITRAMDLHDVAYGRGALPDVLASVRHPALCIGIDSDILYPAHEQRSIAEALPSAEYREIASPYGHDAFLIEFEQMASFVREFLR